jgi:hypothetical protein
MSGLQISPALPHGPNWRWWFVIIGCPVGLFFGTVGFWLYAGQPAGLLPWLNALYHAGQLFVLHTPYLERPMNWCLEVGRWLAAGVFGMTAISALYQLFATEWRHFRVGFAKGHTVICGLGPRALRLARCFLTERGASRVVLVAPAASADDLAACRAAGATLILGDPGKTETLVRAGVHKAKHLVALSGDDRANVEIAVSAYNLMKTRRADGLRALKCFAQLEDVDLRASLQRSGAFPKGDPSCEIRYFDLLDAAARRLLFDPEVLPLDHGGILKGDPRQVHLVLLGFGRLGRSVAVRAAQLGHFANCKPMRISVIDQDAERHEQALLFRYRNFRKTCEIEFHQLQADSQRARELLEGFSSDGQSVTSIAICFDRDSLALEVALRLLPLLKENGIRTAVRLSHSPGFTALLNETSPPDIRFYVRGFAGTEDCCCDDLLGDPLNEELAKVIHEDFRQKRLKEGRDDAVDFALLPWEKLDDGYKDSNKQQADHIAIKLHGIGCTVAELGEQKRPVIDQFTRDQIELLAEMEHARWNAERYLADWALGPSDKARKITPYLVPWDQLEPRIQDYDRATVRLIPTFLRRIGKKVCLNEPVRR